MTRHLTSGLTRTPRIPLQSWLPATLATGLLAAALAPTAGAAVNSCSGTGASFGSGSGTTADPYRVASQAQLEAIRSSTYRTCSYRQTADIALSGPWTSIGTGASMFSGEYDGAGYSISNISMTSGSSYEGLFGYTGNGALLKNIRIAGSVSVPGGSGIGALVGLADRPTTIVNVHSSVNVSGQSRIGGLVGWLAEASISRSSSSGSVTGTGDSLGGLVGYARGAYSGIQSVITNSYSLGSVSGPSGYEGIAGLVGRIESGSPGVSISDSYASGAVTGGQGSRQQCFMGSCITIFGTTGGLVAPSSSASTDPDLSVADSFWDTDATGRSSTANNLGTGKTTSEMKTLSTFTGASWDIADGWNASKVWGICDGSTYPFLTGQYTASPCPAPPSPPPTPAPEPSPTPNPTPDPSPTPTPDPGPSPTPTPSNVFSMRAPGAIGSTVTTTVRVPGPGRLVMRATRNSNAAARLTACRVSREVDRARSVALACRANGATRAAQRHGAVRLSVTVNYTPTGGTARTSAARTVTLKSTEPSYTG